MMKCLRHPVTRFFIIVAILFALISICSAAFATQNYQQQILCKNSSVCIEEIKNLTRDARYSIVAVGFSEDELRKLIAPSERKILVETVTHPTVRFILIDSFIVIKGSMKFDSRPINNLGMYEIITVLANNTIGSVYLNEYLKFKGK